MGNWAQGLLPDQPAWIHDLIEDEFKKREDELTRLRAENDEFADAYAGTIRAYADVVDRLSVELEVLRGIETVAREYVTNSYRPNRKYDAERFDALCEALEDRKSGITRERK